ncbi:hypothetical protein [Paenibacillus sp. FSL R7-0652]|uniref:hypothetical protein n=1 Tax=Paenibacillus sp. FSL R7-0652 TaxID=2921687 RepID=UPI00315AF7B7
MQLRKYPNRFHVRKVIEQFMSSKDAISVFKEQGILVQAYRKKDVAKIAADHYFSRNNFIKLKEKVEAEHNYKKTSRLEIPKEEIEDFKNALLEINGSPLGDDDNTVVTVLETPNDGWEFRIDYTDYRPGMIDLLDQTARRVEVKVNDQIETFSLDFDTILSNDYKKVTQVIEYLRRTNEDIEVNFSEISLKALSCENRIQLFNQFFQYEHQSWMFAEIKKLKVKRDERGDNSEESTVEEDQLQGINSALIDGVNLIENRFVKGTLDNGFYFSMAQMRFDSRENADFIDIAIEFMSRPEKCETKMVSSGYYYYNDSGDRVEETNVLATEDQDSILFEFKNALSQIYKQLCINRKVSFVASDYDVNFFGETAVAEEV